MTLPRSVLFMLCLSVQVTRGADWPQYRGPLRNDVSAEKGLLKEWPAEGPPLVWTFAETGVGYSGPAIVGNRLYTLGGRGETEFLIALDLKSAADGAVSEVWATEVGPLFQFKGNNWSAGPSSTPTVDGDRVYALGGNGRLICVAADSGKELWSSDLPKDLEAEINPIGGGPKKLGWGFTWSSLVDGDRLVCLPGGPKGTVAALDKTTGDVLWRTTEVTDQAAYTSPMPAEIHGVRQYVVLTNRGVFGVRAHDGSVLWNYTRPQRFSTEVVNSPIIRDDLVYVTVGAGQGCELLKIKKGSEEETFTVETVYSNKNMLNHHGNVALVGDHIFGFSEGRGWQCQDFASGNIEWSERRKLRAGSMTCADGHLYLYSEDDGTAVLLEVNTKEWNEKGRFRIPKQTTLRKPSGRIWTPPVVANGRLYLRDQDLLFCYDVVEKK